MPAGCTAAALLAAALPVPAWSQPLAGQDKLSDRPADTLIVQVDKFTSRQRLGKPNADTTAEWLQKTYQSHEGKKPTIAIWPFDKNKIRKSVAIASEYNARLRARMTARAGGRYELVAPDVMAATVDNLRKFGVLGDKDENAIAALFATKLHAEFLVLGSLRKPGRQLYLSYATVKMTGELAGARQCP